MRLVDHKSMHSKRWFLTNKANITPHSYTRNATIREDSFRDRPLWYINPKKTDTPSTVLFIHGGAFAKNFQPIHWRFVQRLVENTCAKVIAPDYPLLPESTYTATQKYFLALLEQISKNESMEQLYVVADTSGATIALNAVQQFREIGLHQPKEIILLSPWLDLTLSNPIIEDLAHHDPVHEVGVLRELGAEYAEGYAPNDPKVSPIYADTRRLAPISVFVGTQDIFLADSRKLKILSESKPVVFNYREYHGMINNWMYYDFPESKQARELLFHHMSSEPSEFELAMQDNAVAW